MKAKVIGGTVTLTGATITAEWDGGRGTETWTLEDTAWGRRESRENFDDMVERWNDEGSYLNAIPIKGKKKGD